MKIEKLSNYEISKRIDEMLNNTDWDEFWDKVVESSSEECDAYRRASAKSLEYNIVFV